MQSLETECGACKVNSLRWPPNLACLGEVRRRIGRASEATRTISGLVLKASEKLLAFKKEDAAVHSVPGLMHFLGTSSSRHLAGDAEAVLGKGPCGAGRCRQAGDCGRWKGAGVVTMWTWPWWVGWTWGVETGQQ